MLQLTDEQARVVPATYYDELSYLDHQTQIAVDTETTGLHPYNGDELIGISTCANGHAVYWPFRHRGGENLPLKYMYPLLRLLETKHVLLYGYNFKFDLHFMAQEGFTAPEYSEDVQIAAHLMNENEPSFKLKLLGDRYIDRDASAEEAKMLEILKEHGGKAKISVLPASIAAPYAAIDAWLTEKLRTFYLPHLQRWRLAQLYREVCDYQMVTWRMERRGVRLDIDRIKQYMQESQDKADQLRKRLVELSNRPINPGSPKQLRAWMEVPSTKRSVLEALGEDNEAAQLILRWRAYSKANSTYYEPYLRFADSNGFIHANYRVTGTRTGRLSCAEPNLQQVARQAGVYAVVKNVFIPRDGYEWFEADYSQAEYRAAAHYAKEESLIAGFIAGEDFHARTAQDLGVNRDLAKQLNFAVLYGMGAPSLASKLGITEEEARGYLDTYHATYPRLKQMMQAVEQMARKTAALSGGTGGYIRLYTGRLRHFNVPELNKVTMAIEPLYHKAGNSMIQGTVAEITRIALTRLDHESRGLLTPLMQIHDAVDGEYPIGHKDEAADELRRVMEDTPFNPPMRIDIKAGPSWGESEKLAYAHN